MDKLAHDPPCAEWGDTSSSLESLTGPVAADRLALVEALLVTGGEAPPLARLEGRRADFGLVCAADSGLDTLVAWDIEPDIIVGDMDSVSSIDLLGRFPGAEVRLSPRDKDETDTELALASLAARGADRIVLAGGGGGRLDHLLAIRSLFERGGTLLPRPVEWHTARDALFLVEEGHTLAIEAERGAIVSVFPLAEGAEGMSSEGLKWPLDGLVWGPRGFGVSNVANEGRFRVRSGRGDLLVVLSFVPVEGSS
jgi:thiamine pyrophosphokinase